MSTDRASPRLLASRKRSERPLLLASRKSTSRASGLLLLLAAALLTPRARADEPAVIAVFDIEVSGVKLARGSADGLTDYLFNKIAAVPGYKVVPRNEVKKRLTAEKKESFRACFDQGCQIEIGRELAAQKTLSTKVLRFGDECTVTLVVYDLRTAATEAAADAGGKCTAPALARSIEAAVTTLARSRAPAQPPQNAASSAALPTTAPVAVQLGVEDPQNCPGKGTKRMGEPYPAGQAIYCIGPDMKMQGTMVAWNTTGKVSMRTDYRNGQMHGKQTIFHKNGAIFQEGLYADNVKTGIWTSYFDDGVKMEEGNYDHGGKTGLWTQFDRDGKKSAETEYRSDTRHGKHTEYLADGTVRRTGKYSEDKEDGLWTELRADGTKQEEKNYRAGRLHGAELELDTQGRKTRLRTWSDGKLNGPYESWSRKSDGTTYLEERGQYQDGQRDGLWTKLDSDGAERSTTTYSRDKKHGPYMSWSTSGGKRYKSEEGRYLDDKKDGAWKRFSPEGTVQREESWVDGKQSQ